MEGRKQRGEVEPQTVTFLMAPAAQRSSARPPQEDLIIAPIPVAWLTSSITVFFLNFFIGFFFLLLCVFSTSLRLRLN